MAKEKFFLYHIEFLDKVMSKKLYFTERIGPTLRAIMHKGENIKPQFEKDKKYFIFRLSRVKKEKTREKIRFILKQINELICLFNKSKRKMILKD